MLCDWLYCIMSAVSMVTVSLPLTPPTCHVYQSGEGQVTVWWMWLLSLTVLSTVEPM